MTAIARSEISPETHGPGQGRPQGRSPAHVAALPADTPPGCQRPHPPGRRVEAGPIKGLLSAAADWAPQG